MTKFEHQYEVGLPKITMEIDKDSTFPELLDAFVAFATAMTYAEATIRKGIRELAEEYIEEGIEYEGRY